MAPAKGSRSRIKISPEGNEDWCDEDPTTSNKTKLKKRKISDMLGPQWSEDELQRFYEAYHKYGKDWKKVGAVIRNRSADMVEALYNRNKVYLSLPEDRAPVAGLLASMTAHYNVMNEIESNRESDQMVKPSGKAQKRGVAKRQVGTQKRYDGHHRGNFHSKQSSYGFSSLFKKKYYGDLVENTQRHAVGKRTPRIPIVFSGDRNGDNNIASENEYIVNSNMNGGEEIANSNCIRRVINGCFTEGNLRTMGANRVVLTRDGTSVGAKGIGGVSKSASRQDLRKNEQSNREDVVMAKEGNDTDDSRSLSERISDLFSPDEIFALDVLQNLVNLFPTKPRSDINIDSGKIENDKSKIFDKREGGHSPDDHKEGNQESCSMQEEICFDECHAPKTSKKQKKKFLGEELNGGTLMVPSLGTLQEVSAKEGKIPVNDCLVSSPQEQLLDSPKFSSNSDLEQAEMTLPESTSNIPGGLHFDMPIEHKPEDTPKRSKRKSKVQYKKVETKYEDSCHDKQSLRGNDGATTTQEKLLHCLSSQLLRRWCVYEWFYSSIDYPWFARNEFVEYLNHANLGHVPRLTRSEWSTIRSSLGKPRRFSDQFLLEEREKLEKYRESVRTYYTELRAGLKDGLPVDLARPLLVGQRVIVCHPRTRELHDGTILIVDQKCCKVQFDRPDLGIELVMDIDCMPVNWWENLPEDLRKQSSSPNHVHNKLKIGHCTKPAPDERFFCNTKETSMSVPFHRGRIVLDELPEVHSPRDSLRSHDTFDRSAMLPSLLSVSDMGQANFGSSVKCGDQDHDLKSYVTALVQSLMSQARAMVDAAKQADAMDEQCPSELISYCVAILLAIKYLSETRHPPAYIAAVLELLAAMLQPLCSRNFTIYKEIEMCLGIIKNLMLALIPTPSNGHPAATTM